MACSDSQSRTQWLPAFVNLPFSNYPATNNNSVGSLNASARGLTDRIAFLDTRGPGRLASRVKWLSVENFSGINGDGTLNLHGFDVRGDRNTDTLRIILINHRPPVDPVTGEALDATMLGANSTIEQFQTKVGSETMRHVRTYVNPLIQTPNRVAWVSDHSFLFTNDHSNKVGFVSFLF
jgi:arylesterase/paraoxonase